MIREYYNSDLADALDTIIEENKIIIYDAEKEHEVLMQEIDDLSDSIENLKGKIFGLKRRRE